MTNFIYLFKKQFLLFFIATLFCFNAKGQVVNFTGVVNTNWHNASNWDTGVIPTNSDSVFVDQDVNVNSDAEFRFMDLTSGMMTIATGVTVEFVDNISVTLNGVLKNEGILKNTDTVYNSEIETVLYLSDATVDNLNELELIKKDNNLFVIDTDGKLKNEGILTLNGVENSFAPFPRALAVENNGSINNKLNGTITINQIYEGLDMGGDTLINKGDILIDSTTASFKINFNATLINFGTITLEDDAGKLNINSEAINQAGGTIILNDAGGSADGFIVSDEFNNFGTIEMNYSPGSFLFNGLNILAGGGNFINQSGGSIIINGQSIQTALKVGGSLVNKPGGNIELTSFNNQGIHCLYDLNNRGAITINDPGGVTAVFVEGDLINGVDGIISISEINKGLRILGDFENEEIISISDVETPLLLEGGMTNQTTGSISISNMSASNPKGIQCKTGNYRNYGSIDLSEISSSSGGLLVTDDADFLNDGGTISIDDSKKGIYLQLNGSQQGTFTNKNSGVINITNVDSVGIDIEGAGSVVTHFDNQATATVNINGAVDGIYSEANFQNTGLLNIENTTTAIKNVGGTFEGDFLNDGNLNIQTSTTGISMFNELGDTEDNTFFNEGTITFDDFGTNYIVDGNSSKRLNNNGNILGQGYINGSYFILSSILEPGNSPGEMVINNEFNTNTNSGYLMEIAGNSGSGITNGHDRIIINVVTPTLDGILDVTLLNGFVPAIGDSYELFQCQTSCIENFATVNLPSLPPDRLWQLNNTGGSITLAVESILPIELLSFDAVKENGQVRLNWATASEVNNSHFEIERSPDGNNWSIIGSLESHHNSYERNDYFFIDQIENLALPNELYYRLKSIDYDGRFDFSEIRQVSFELQNITIQPNPFSHKLSLIVPEDGAFEIRLFDELGRLVTSFQESGNIIEIDQLEFLPVGVYNLQILSESMLIQQERLVKIE